MGALEEVRDLAQSVAHRRSLRLWDVAMDGGSRGSIVRVFVDGDEVDLDTIAEVSEEISRGLDLRDPIPGRYTLEVSTPGLERTLRTPEHFASAVGRKVVMKTRDRLVADSHRIEGEIVAADEQGVTLRTARDDVSVPLEQVRTARTIFEWK